MKMKKLALSLALILGLSMSSFAQGFINSMEEYEERGLFGRGLGLFREEEESPLLLPKEHGLTENQDAPLGSGIVVLMGLGAAYVVAKKRED